MNIKIREYSSDDMVPIMKIWNQVVDDGVAFPQEEDLTLRDTDEFFKGQTFTGVAEDIDSGEILGLYILHPNNVGRCGHICNASYAVRRDARGQHVGEAMVRDCLKMAGKKGFRILQFNAVVATNEHAIHLYQRLGFQEIGRVKGGFHMPDGTYQDILLFYHDVVGGENE